MRLWKALHGSCSSLICMSREACCHIPATSPLWRALAPVVRPEIWNHWKTSLGKGLIPPHPFLGRSRTRARRLPLPVTNPWGQDPGGDPSLLRDIQTTGRRLAQRRALWHDKYGCPWARLEIQAQAHQSLREAPQIFTAWERQRRRFVQRRMSQSTWHKPKCGQGPPRAHRPLNGAQRSLSSPVTTRMHSLVRFLQCESDQRRRPKLSECLLLARWCQPLLCLLGHRVSGPAGLASSLPGSFLCPPPRHHQSHRPSRLRCWRLRLEPARSCTRPLAALACHGRPPEPSCCPRSRRLREPCPLPPAPQLPRASGGLTRAPLPRPCPAPCTSGLPSASPLSPSLPPQPQSTPTTPYRQPPHACPPRPPRQLQLVRRSRRLPRPTWWRLLLPRHVLRPLASPLLPGPLVWLADSLRRPP